MTNFEKYKQDLTEEIFIDATILNCDGCPCFPCMEELPTCGTECEEQLQKWCDEAVK